MAAVIGAAAAVMVNGIFGFGGVGWRLTTDRRDAM